MNYLLILFLLLCLPLKSFAVACDHLRLMGLSGVDLTSNQTMNPSFQVRADTRDGGCDFFITINYGSSSSYSTRSLKYSGNNWTFQLSKDSAGTQIIKAHPDLSGTSSVITGTLPAGSNNSQVTVNYWAILNMTNPWILNGTYLDTFTFSLYQGSNLSNTTTADTGSVQFQYIAPKKVDLSIVQTGGSFALADTTETLDFGILNAGQTKSCDAIVKYNAGYILYASSANANRLKHQTMSQYINYSLTFNGVAFNLTSTAQEIRRQTGVSPASGTVIPISATVGSLAGKSSGLYTDTITLTVQSP